MVHEPPRQVRGCEHAKQGIADVEQRYARLLASVVDGVACAAAAKVQQLSLLSDAAELLASLGRFATVGAKF